MMMSVLVAPAYVLIQMIRQGGAGARVDQQRFRGDPFGIGDLVLIKQQLEVIYKAAGLLKNGFPVDQVADLDRHLVVPGTQSVLPLIDGQP